LVRETAELAIAHIQKYNPELAQQLLAHQKVIPPALINPEDLSTVVSRVVDYLQTGQEQLSIPTAMRQQALDSNLLSNEVQAFLRMAQLMDLGDLNNPMAATEVTAIAETMAQLLDLPAWQIKRLKLAALLHRIDPLRTAQSVLTSSKVTNEETAPSCPLVPGAQVLRKMPRLRALAQIITHQTEYWDGTGEPAGLAGDAIPLESRILALVADFQWRVNQQKSSQQPREEIFAQALAECRQQSDRFDPKLLDALTLLVMGLQKGIDLPIMTSKVSTGMWLLDSRWDSQNKTSKEINSYPQ
jgi:HD-GYP domain-containing protein (c-di-GMP phosphodiesterase class II)